MTKEEMIMEKLTALTEKVEKLEKLDNGRKLKKKLKESDIDWSNYDDFVESAKYSIWMLANKSDLFKSLGDSAIDKFVDMYGTGAAERFYSACEDGEEDFEDVLHRRKDLFDCAVELMVSAALEI